MPAYTTKVRPDGTIEIPPELGARLGIKPGHEVEFFRFCAISCG